MWIRRAVEKAGRFVHRGVTHARHFAHSVDRGVRVGRQLYGAIAPILDQYAGKAHARPVMKALQGYDDLRRQVLGHAENASIVAGAVAKSIPSIGL